MGHPVSVNIYRVSHKGWDCKDDIKPFKFDKSEVNLNINFSLLIQWLGEKLVAGNHKYNETAGISSGQASLKSCPL